MVFYVLCPFRVTSGGPELLHQLVAALNSLNYEAYITYMCTRQDFDDVDTVIPAEYQMYVTDFRLIGDVVDEKDSVIVFPETLSYLLPQYKNAQKVFWWLSVGNYFYVAPIKISVDGLSELQTQRDNGEISNAQYNIEVQKLFDRNKELVSVRNAETGEVEDTISVNTLETYLQRDVKGSTENKVEQYRKYFYLYNDDDTYKNADYNAVFGVNASGTEAITPEGYEDEAIQEAILKLYNDGNAEIGDMSEIVQADDGFYVFFYAGKVQNLFDVTSSFDASNDQENIKILASTKLNVFSSKTLLDLSCISAIILLGL